jgi:hypothetical protein
MLPLDFGAPALEVLAVMDISQHAAMRFFMGDAAVCGEVWLLP